MPAPDAPRDVSGRPKLPVALVVWTLRGMGGSERLVYEIVRRIDRSAFVPIVVSFEDGAVRALYEELGVKVYCVSKRKKLDFGFLRQIRRLVVANGIRVINAHHFGPHLYALASVLFTGIPIVVTEHSLWEIDERNRFMKMVTRLLYLRTARVIAVSRQVRDYLIAFMPSIESKVRLLSNGTDLERFRRVDKAYARQRLGFDEDWRVVGIVANIRPEKNHRMLISAFAKLSATDDRLRLVIAGLDCMDRAIQRYAEEKGVSSKIIFLGPREDVPELLSSFDVFCLPSVHEGLPLSLLEAMAAQVPILASDVVGINGIVSHNDNGMLFSLDDEGELVEAMRMLLDSPGVRQRLTAQGLEFVRKHYDVNAMMKSYEQLLKECCDPRSGASIEAPGR